MTKSIKPKTKFFQRGDTLIEVLIAMAVLSAMIVAASTLMTNGLKSAQTALEHTLVRNEINSQAELLRYLRDSYIKDRTLPASTEWTRILTTYTNTTAAAYTTACTTTAGKTPFYLAQNLANQIPAVATTFNPSLLPPSHATPGRGLWVESTRGTTTSGVNYIDFQIRACWSKTGNANIRQQSGTVVRLYDAQ